MSKCDQTFACATHASALRHIKVTLSSCRHVVLPKELSKLVPSSHLMSEDEWRGLGVQQSQGWMHYMIHKPGKYGGTKLIGLDFSTQSLVFNKTWVKWAAGLAKLVFEEIFIMQTLQWHHLWPLSGCAADLRLSVTPLHCLFISVWLTEGDKACVANANRSSSLLSSSQSPISSSSGDLSQRIEQESAITFIDPRCLNTSCYFCAFCVEEV